MAYMNAIPTMPSPTTTTFFRCEGVSGYFSGSLSSSVCALGGSLLIAMPGDEVAQDILCCELLYDCAHQHCKNVTKEATTKEVKCNERIKSKMREKPKECWPHKLLHSERNSSRGGIANDDLTPRSTASSDSRGLSYPLQWICDSARSLRARGRASQLAAKTCVCMVEPIMDLQGRIQSD